MEEDLDVDDCGEEFGERQFGEESIRVYYDNEDVE